jgi:hypothetical protein
MKNKFFILILLISSINVFGQERSFRFQQDIGNLFYSIELVPDTFLCIRLHKPPTYELGLKHLSEYILPDYPREYVDNKFVMPKIDGIFEASFSIDNEGFPTNIVIHKSPHPKMDKQFKEKCKKLKSFIPASYESDTLKTKIICIAKYKSR